MIETWKSYRRWEPSFLYYTSCTVPIHNYYHIVSKLQPGHATVQYCSGILLPPILFYTSISQIELNRIHSFLETETEPRMNIRQSVPMSIERLLESNRIGTTGVHCTVLHCSLQGSEPCKPLFVLSARFSESYHRIESKIEVRKYAPRHRQAIIWISFNCFITFIFMVLDIGMTSLVCSIHVSAIQWHSFFPLSFR